MGKPQVDIVVDEETGRWSVDALPMVLVPQHFLLNHHRVLEAELGAQRLERLLHPAGFDSAYHWCREEAAHHGLSGEAVFRHYMRRISQRGWGQFEVLGLDAVTGTAAIRLRHSVFVQPDKPGQKCCYRFAAWFEGALAFVASPAEGRRRFEARELHCAAAGEHDHCLFELRSAA